MTIRVKICGVRTPDDARVAAEAGADFIGLVLTQSPRQITVEQAQAIAAVLGRRPALPPAPDRPAHERLEAALAVRRPLLVGVFGDEPAGEIAATARATGIDVVQLSGREAATQAAALAGHEMFVVFRPRPGARLADLPAFALPLLDAPHATKLGGTGLRVDMALAARYAAARPVMLAGGLTPDNVAQAIVEVRPWGVDVSSGVETDGAKDHDKMRAFVAAAKAVQLPERRDQSSGPSTQAKGLVIARTDRPEGLSEENFPQRRSSPRLKDFDYIGPYAYSLAISTSGYRPLLKDERTVLECLDVLSEAATRHAVTIHAYCFMPNHLHLVVQGSENSSLTAFAKRFKQRSAYLYKQRMGRSLWHRSYYDHVLRREEDLRAAAEYVWNNPVQAGLAGAREEYPYSGPPELLGSGKGGQT